MKLNTESTQSPAQQLEQNRPGLVGVASAPARPTCTTLDIISPPVDSVGNLPGAAVSESAVENSAASNPFTGRKRNGAVARLSKELRQRVNELLDDNLTYAQIVDELGDAGKPLDNDSIRRWKKGGYQDYLRDQRLLEQCRQRRSNLSTLLSDRSHVSGFQATQQIAVGQMLEILTESGDDFLREALQANPMNYFRMLNAFSRLTNGGLKCERLALEQQDRQAEAQAAKQPPKKKGLSDEAVAEMKSKLSLM
jgi:hypothetical protein